MFHRSLTIEIENLTDDDTSFVFGGEWFETGNWVSERTTRIEERAVLEFESKTFLNGASGYVYFHTIDLSQILVFFFACPVATACCFTARVSATLPDCCALFARVPSLGRPGAGLRRTETAEGLLDCAWETLELQDHHTTVRFIILPNSGTSKRVSEELGRRLNKAKLCRSALDDTPVSDAWGLGWKGCQVEERRVILEVDNRSDETFVYDGSWFESGQWLASPAVSLKPRAVTRLICVSNEVIGGVYGMAWFVNEDGLNTYVSIVFSNPFAGEGAFNSWAGPPPHDLRQEMFEAPNLGSQQGVQVPQGRGCAWNVVERGSTVRIRIAVLEDLAPMDLMAYPPKKAAEEVNAGAGGDIQAPAVGVFPSCAPAAAAETAVAEAAVEAMSDTDAFDGPGAEATTTGEDGAGSNAEGGPGIGPAGANDTLEETSISAIERVLNVTRPRDALDGLASGLKAASAGLAAGSVALVAVPIVGAREEGISGFLTGIAKGACGFCAFGIGGVVAGAAQIVRGVANTPEAVKQVQAGKRWDAENGVWVDDTCDLRTEAAEAATVESDGEMSDGEEEGEEGEEGEDGRPSKRVADTAYYDTIGVSPTASTDAIKRAYYKAALRVHPDKNPGDPEASQRFQQLAQAYQVLSDPKLRERYDRMGQEAVSDAALPSIDPMLFFSMLFGSEQFERYIGKLYLATQADHMAKTLQRDMERRQKSESADSQVPTRDVIGDSIEREIHWYPGSKKAQRMKRQQFAREVTCSTQLCERLDRWVSGRDEVGFMNSVVQEASDLVRVSFGGKLLRTIGFIYERSADQFLASLRGNFTIESGINQVRDRSHAAQVRFSAVSSVARSAFAVKHMHDVAGNAANSEDEQDQDKKEEAAKQTMSSLEDSLPVFLQTIWDVSAVDIDSTLHHVCGKVLKDISVPWQIRYRRAIALRRLGRVFRDVGQFEHNDLSQSQVAKQHLEEALYGAIREKG